MPGRNNPARAEVCPDAGAGFLIGVGRQQTRAVVWVSVFEELADDGALVERFGVVLERRDQAAGVEGEKRGGLVVGVDFDVLVGDFLLFEDGPGALDEGAAVVGWDGELLLSARIGSGEGTRTYNQPE